MDRARHRVPNTPPDATAYLLRDWCTSSEEEYLLGRVYHGSASSKKKWTEVSGRRLQNLSGVVHPKGLIPTPVPEWLAKTMAKVRASAGDLLPAPINHVLVNEYQPGDGIFPHQDGAAYYPAVAIVSLGCDVVMRFSPRRDETSNETKTKTSNDDGSLVSFPFGVFTPRRSLLVFDGALYERYLHGIDAVREDVIDATVANRGEFFAANDSSTIDGQSDEDVAAANKKVDAFPTLRRDGVRVSMTFRNVRVVRAALRLFG